MGIRLNQRGSALITGMIAALSIGVVSAIILQQSQVTEKQTRIPRVKSAMLAAEMQLREALTQAKFLKPCRSGQSGCLELDHTFLDAMEQEVPGAQCSARPCGISIKDRTFFGNRFTASIVYNGTEVSVAPVLISMTTETEEAWTLMNPTCPVVQPLLVGFENNGNPICRALPIDCAPGSYVHNIDPMSLTSGGVLCEPFPALVSCPAGQIMIGFVWRGGGRGGVPQCMPLMSPFDPAALNDPTTYAYSPAITPVLSSWPVTTTTVPCAVPLTWSCSGAECSPGPAAGCSYAGFRAAHAAPDMEGQVCATRGSFYSFQRTSPASVTCDVGHLSCQCGGGPITTTTMVVGSYNWERRGHVYGPGMGCHLGADQNSATQDVARGTLIKHGNCPHCDFTVNETNNPCNSATDGQTIIVYNGCGDWQAGLEGYSGYRCELSTGSYPAF